MTWLVTGGAGYIGAHVVHALLAAGESVAVLDNLSTGVADRVPEDVPFIKADVRDLPAVREAVGAYAITGVVHLAARKDVADSAVDPLGYYRDNLNGLRAVLAAAAEHRAKDFVFSSSAAVYGPSPDGRVDEGSPTAPSNAYGRTKLVGEWMVADAAEAAGLRYANLRYFNVAGAGSAALGDIGETNLVPRLLRAVTDGRPAEIYGTAHPTPDGSCVRDYVHVNDIADAHVVAARALRDGRITAETLNVGRGVGVSVLEMIDQVRRACQRPLPAVAAPPRPGDPPSVVASARRIERVLGWRASRDLTDIVSSAWAALCPPA